MAVGGGGVTYEAGVAVAEAVADFFEVAWTALLVVAETATGFEVVKDRRGWAKALTALLAWRLPERSIFVGWELRWRSGEGITRTRTRKRKKSTSYLAVFWSLEGLQEGSMKVMHQISRDRGEMC